MKLFQSVLQYNPNCIPDPRIGIGLCFWATDQKTRAKAAWQRSLEVVSDSCCCSSLPLIHYILQNPSEWSAQLLLGLEAINASKNETLSDGERAESFVRGTRLVEAAFKANKYSAAAANALCELFLKKGNYPRVRGFHSGSLTCS